MSISSLAIAGRNALRSLLWGAAHALDVGRVLLGESYWGAVEADARPLRGDWMVALHHAEGGLPASEAGEAE